MVDRYMLPLPAMGGILYIASLVGEMGAVMHGINHDHAWADFQVMALLDSLSLISSSFDLPLPILSHHGLGVSAHSINSLSSLL